MTDDGPPDIMPPDLMLPLRATILEPYSGPTLAELITEHLTHAGVWIRPEYDERWRNEVRWLVARMTTELSNLLMYSRCEAADAAVKQLDPYLAEAVCLRSLIERFSGKDTVPISVSDPNA